MMAELGRLCCSLFKKFPHASPASNFGRGSRFGPFFITVGALPHPPLRRPSMRQFLVLGLGAKKFGVLEIEIVI